MNVFQYQICSILHLAQRQDTMESSKAHRQLLVRRPIKKIPTRQQALYQHCFEYNLTCIQFYQIPYVKENGKARALCPQRCIRSLREQVSHSCYRPTGPAYHTQCFILSDLEVSHRVHILLNDSSIEDMFDYSACAASILSRDLRIYHFRVRRGLFGVEPCRLRSTIGSSQQ